MTGNLVGKRLGKYEIQAEIGKGGMGIVYKGYDPLLDRQVAVKVLAPHLVWEPGFVERFLREARSAARLKHTGIVGIYDVGQQGDWYYIVMECLEGQTLAQLIRQHGPFTPQQTLSILRQLAEALDYAHRCGLVHRDVKPANVVVDADGHATLTDFGVAWAAQETRLTTTGAMVGTPRYMSPEQAQGEALDHRTDVYSLGVVAYEMLTGQAPFNATTPHAVLHQLIYESPPSVRSRRSDLAEEVDQVLGKALAKQASARYERVTDLVSALGQVLVGKVPSRSAQPPPAALAPTQLAPPPIRREAVSRPQNAWILWLGWVLVSAAGWALGWAAGRPISEVVGRPFAETGNLVLMEVVAGAAAWGVLGLVIGVAQWLMLRRHVRNAGWWMLATSVSLAVVGSVKWNEGPLIEGAMFELEGWLERTGWAMTAPLFWIGLGMVLNGFTGLVVGTAQWFVLRRQMRRAGRWAWITALGWALAAVLLGFLGWALGPAGEEIMFWLVPAIGGIVPGAVTAAGLVRLLSERRDTSPRVPEHQAR
jgi:hypothetical protein